MIENDVDKNRIKQVLTENLKDIEAMRANGEEPIPKQVNPIPGARLDEKSHHSGMQSSRRGPLPAPGG